MLRNPTHPGGSTISFESLVRSRPGRIPTISLQFGAGVASVTRARISYAFRVFAAIYGYKVVQAYETAALRCLYGAQQAGSPQPGVLYIPALYRDVRLLNAWKRRLALYRYAGEDFPLAFGMEASSGKPDWLGELFLWLSSSYELEIFKRDDVGRIPFPEMIFNRAGFSPGKPYASKLMAWMETALCDETEQQTLRRAPSPIPGIEHFVVSSHDIDFYFVDRISAMVRLLKNLVIGVSPYRNYSFFSDNLKMILRLFRGYRVGHYLPELFRAGEEYGFRSTLFVVARHGHRRDPNYRLDQLVPFLSDAAEKDFPAGVHGSYRSLMEDRALRSEARALGEFTGSKPLAGRQHWLRFDEHQRLFEEIRRAEFLCDSSLGFSDAIGFRNGASFAFPPYDFESERPYPFLEVPLVLMDGGLEAASRSLKKCPKKLADEVLGESRKYGWGGISILWHNPIEPLQVPAEINQVFWDCAQEKREFQEIWVSFDQFLDCSLERYRNAGLLEGVRLHG